jgi:hypothetical protein
MILPRGITGFGGVRATSDMRVFRSCCFTAARLVGGTVTSFDPSPQVARSYALAVLTLPGRTVAVVLNAYFPVVAFAEPPVEGEVVLRFRDEPELAALFQQFGVYEVLEASCLDEPLIQEGIYKLGPEELKQAAYHRPDRVGDVIFNYWD